MEEMNVTMDATNAVPIILNKMFVNGYSDRPKRYHKKKRIQKKWIKKYGYQFEPSSEIFVTENDGRRAIAMHPAVFRTLSKKTGSDEKAARTLIEYFKDRLQGES